ncbi:hypothetical protein [Desulfosediminicola flagellatus]|nr:hypothetical protein [Desulfosediminicola flagellatus]
MGLGYVSKRKDIVFGTASPLGQHVIVDIKFFKWRTTGGIEVRQIKVTI